MITAKSALAGAFLLLAATLPAHALTCNGSTEDGFTFEFGFQLGERYTEADRNQFDLMRLRQAGVDVTRVERWSNCIRAYVRKPGGGEEMQFYDPGSLRRVQ